MRLAIYFLYEGRQREMPEPVKEAWNDALKFLADVSTGKASLDQPAAPQTTELDVVTRDHATDPEVFDKTRMDGF